MRLRVLGPMQVRRADRWISISASKERALLATLLVYSGSPVPTDRLVEELWPQTPPRRPASRIAVLVLRLRRALGDNRAADIQTVSHGYQLALAQDDTDIGRFERLAERGTAALRDGDPETAVRLVTDALALWRGPAFADARSTQPVNAEAKRLDDARQAVLETRLDAELRLGRHAELVAELQTVVDEYPLRERPVGLLMLALYRSGRQADALATYRAAYRKLDEEVGVQPGADLQRLHQQILRADPVLELTGTGPASEPEPGVPGRAVPQQLPIVTRHFVGREQVLKQLDELVESSGQSVMISAVTGTAGIGKTTMAVHWAHQAAERFPDGQLYINLRGFDPARPPMPAEEALGRLLDTLVPNPRDLQPLPSDLDGQATMYRSLLAGRRILIVLDNAADVDQVRPLLPGSPACFVLVTSRTELTGLVAAEGAHPLRLDLLTETESEQLLVRHLGPERVAAERAAAGMLARSCAYLPLALTIAAARAAVRPTMPLAELAGSITRAASTARLDALDTGDPATGVRTVFSWSYDNMSSETARLFRLLSVHPGPDISTAAAGSLAGLSSACTRRFLAELVRANLLTEQAPGRYGCHDLLSTYAAELNQSRDTEANRRAALQRMLDHYLQTAHAATLQIPTARKLPTPPVLSTGVQHEEFSDRDQAMAWFTTEHRVLVRVIALTAQHGFDTHTAQLTRRVEDFLIRAGHWRDLLSILRLTLDAGINLDDQTIQAFAHRGLGAVHGRLGNADALSHFQEALELVVDPIDRAITLSNLANVHDRLGDYDRALGYAREALDLYHSAGHLQGQANCLNSIGWLYARFDHPDLALAHCRQALQLFRQLDDPNGQANTLDTMGWAHHRLGHHQEAVTCFENALDLFRRSGARLQEAESLIRLGDIQHAAGNHIAAREVWQRALTFFEETGHPRADALRAKLHERP